MNSKGFWYFLMAGAVGLWVAVLLAAILVPSISMIAWIVFIALAALHVLEFPLISKKIADGKGISGRTAFIKTILFGFTWWLALKKGIIEK
ncbi:MAG: hypothetical protein ABSF13_13815 [Smithella sp.]|jgi:hypothetical protein